MARLTQYPMSIDLGPGMVITAITIGVHCPHCDKLLLVGDTMFCPHVTTEDLVFNQPKDADAQKSTT